MDLPALARRHRVERHRAGGAHRLLRGAVGLALEGQASAGPVALGVHDDASLEALDHELDDSLEAIREAAALIAHVEELERIEAFAEALRRELVLPEDF